MLSTTHPGATWLVGGGELGRLIRCKDWSATPFGPFDQWSATLRSLVSLVVATPWPIALLWGCDQLLLYNDAYAVLAGERHPAALGRTAREALAELWGPYEPIVRSVLEKGEAVQVAGSSVRSASGSLDDGPFGYCCSPVRDEGGAVAGALLMCQAMPGAQAETTPWTPTPEGYQAAQLEAILNGIGDGLIVYDREGRTQRSTEAADEILGIPPGERVLPVHLRASDQYEITDEDGRRLELDEMPPVRAALHGETVRGIVLSIRSKSASAPRWVRMNAIPYFLEGRHMGAVLSMTDITARKKIEEDLTRANDRLRDTDRRKNEFLAMLSHELRNPLAPMRNSLYILERAPAGGQQARRAHEVIGRQVTHLARLIDDLLDVTRISRGKIRLQPERVELCGLLERTAEDHRSTFLANGIELEVEACKHAVHTSGDPTRLSQVIGNLLSNAAKFTPRGGHVSISLGTERGHAVIRVRDDGPGMSAELLANLFQPFVQAEMTLDRSKGGLGLGLALVRGLVELHGGAVSASSDGPGQGAEFRITLPLERTDSRRPEVEPRERSAHLRRSLRVLVIEDSPDAAESLAIALGFGGHEVETAATGPEGLELARAFRPDVILCDLGLPGIDGFEVARRLRADPELRDTPLVALSGYAAPEDFDRSREAGFDQHLAKPPDLDQLQSTLSDVTRVRRMARAH